MKRGFLSQNIGGAERIVCTLHWINIGSGIVRDVYRGGIGSCPPFGRRRRLKTRPRASTGRLGALPTHHPSLWRAHEGLKFALGACPPPPLSRVSKYAPGYRRIFIPTRRGNKGAGLPRAEGKCFCLQIESSRLHKFSYDPLSYGTTWRLRSQ